MKLKPILLAILFVAMFGLAGCADGRGYYGSYGPPFGYYSGFDRGRFYHDHWEGHGFRHFGGDGFHDGGIARGGGFRGGFGGGHFGGGHFGGGHSGGSHH
jgi:hypothetical protein